jgi:hypothetical protein
VIRPRLSQWVSGSATVLLVALVATPLWDFFHYRSLRTGPGPGLAVGLILPPAPAPRPSLAAGVMPPAAIPARLPAAAATGATSPVTRSALAETAAVAEPSLGAPPTTREAWDRHAQTTPKKKDQPREARSAGPQPGERPVKTTSGGGDGAAPTAAWLLATAAAPVPAPQPAKPSLPPDPQPAPPPNRHLDPTPLVTDPRPVPQALPVLSLGAPPDDVAIGQDVVVNVLLSGARGVTSLPFHLQFDPAVVEFVSATQGSALSGSLQPVLLASVNPARPGDLAVGLSFIDAGGAFDGSGTILSLQFRALASGVSPLAFDRASVRGPTSQPLQAQFQSASVRVR